MSSTTELTRRERLILQSVIHNFILTANPVGSRTLARKYNLDLSAATVRNTMADLEEMGLLTHQHTSAGRTPTDLGYRLYVDNLMRVEELTDAERSTLRSHIDNLSQEKSEILDDISNLLAEVSSMLAVVLAPDLTAGILDKIELVRVSSGRIMVVVIITSGMVRTIILELNSMIIDEDIASAAAILNRKLSGMRLQNIGAQINERLAGTSATKNSIVRLFIDFPERIFAQSPAQDMHIGSTRHVLEHPEYSTPDQLKGIVELIEDRDIIVHLLKDRELGISVTIGSENDSEQFKDKSVITSTYRTGGAFGTVGIIGPTRMNYSKLMALVDYTSKSVTKRTGS